MKYSLALTLLLLGTRLYAATTMDTLPITVADVGQVLEVNPTNQNAELNPTDFQITKTLIKFDAPKKVTFRYTSSPTTRELKLPGTTSSVTLLTYVPKAGGDIKPFAFWVTGSEGGAIYSSFPFDRTKVKFTKSEIIDGVFTMRAASTQDFSEPEYRIQILTSDK